MSDPLNTYYVDFDNDVHEVVSEGDEFRCNDCGAEGFADGYTCSTSGAQAWHDSL